MTCNSNDYDNNNSNNNHHKGDDGRNNNVHNHTNHGNTM